MARRALLIVIAVLGLVAVVTGAIEVFLGPAFAPGGEAINASLDSEWRFVHVLWLGAGLILWWSLRAPAERALVTRTILALAALGGIGRLISVFLMGWPNPVFIGALVVELVVVPIVIVWHWRIYPPEARHSPPPARSRSTPG